MPTSDQHNYFNFMGTLQLVKIENEGKWHPFCLLV